MNGIEIPTKIVWYTTCYPFVILIISVQQLEVPASEFLLSFEGKVKLVAQHRMGTFPSVNWDQLTTDVCHISHGSGISTKLFL